MDLMWALGILDGISLPCVVVPDIPTASDVAYITQFGSFVTALKNSCVVLSHLTLMA